MKENTRVMTERFTGRFMQMQLASWKVQRCSVGSWEAHIIGQLEKNLDFSVQNESLKVYRKNV